MGISRHSLSRREFAKTTLAAGVAAMAGSLAGCALSMGSQAAGVVAAPQLTGTEVVKP